MSRNDGGPAYPLTWMQRTDQGRGERVEHRTPGMTLRDYFAAKAMQAIVSTVPHLATVAPGDVAEEAYQFADALIAERAK